MKREEALNVAKPILFSTETVRAIQDSRKTVPRRVVKFNAKYGKSRFEYDAITQNFLEVEEDVEGETHGINSDGSHWHRLLRTQQIAPPYKVGDILYVREAWGRMNANECGDFDCPRYCMSRGFCYRYRADCDDKSRISDGWFPSIHMPKEAARIFLRVTGVRAERLQDSFFKSGNTIFVLLMEGVDIGEQCRECIDTYRTPCCIDDESECGILDEVQLFSDLWNGIIKKSDLDKYGWNADPWVWVIEFEKVEVT